MLRAGVRRLLLALLALPQAAIALRHVRNGKAPTLTYPNLTAMEEGVMSMVNTGEPEKVLEALAGVNQSLQRAQGKLDLVWLELKRRVGSAASSVAECNQSNQSQNFLAEAFSFQVVEGKHKECRRRQAELQGASHSCEKSLRAASMDSHKACKAFNKANEPRELNLAIMRRPSESREDWLVRKLQELKAERMRLQELKARCANRTSYQEDVAMSCNTAKRLFESQADECGRQMRGAKDILCSWRQRQLPHCKDYAECYSAKSQAFIRMKSNSSTEIERWSKNHLALGRMSCVASASSRLGGQVLSQAQVEACRKQAELELGLRGLELPGLPPRAPCQDAPDHCTVVEDAKALLPRTNFACRPCASTLILP